MKKEELIGDLEDRLNDFVEDLREMDLPSRMWPYATEGAFGEALDLAGDINASFGTRITALRSCVELLEAWISMFRAIYASLERHNLCLTSSAFDKDA